MLEQGAALRFPIYDANGILLLAQGALINDRLRQILEVRGITLEIQASLKLLEGGKSLKGGQIGLEIPIDKSFIDLGRRPDCDLQLASRVVSGHHCRIIKAGFAVLLRDVGSANGTFLNGMRLTEVTELKNNDQIRVGHFTFKVQILAALAADSNEGKTALKAWLLEETPSRSPLSQESRTEPEVDLDSMMSHRS
jgi:pSer/pThr/pTyr-binding forkhead associated (FHA) protein